MIDPGAYFVGALGAFLVFLAWIPLFKDSVRGRRVSPEFELLMFFGAVLLTMYAYWLGDVVFTLLNLGVAVMSFLALEYVPRRAARQRILKKLEEVQREIEKLELKPVKVTAAKTRKTTSKKTVKKRTASRKTTAKKKTASKKTTRRKTTSRKTTRKKK